MKKILQYTLLEFKILFRVPISLFFTILFPQMLLFLFVLISNNAIVYDNTHFVDVYLPAMMVLSMFSSGIISFAINVAENRNRKTWTVYRLKGFKTSQIILSQMFVNILLQFISSLLLIISSSVFFNVKLPSISNTLLFIPAWFLGSICITMIGFLVGIFSKNEKAAQAIATPLMFMVMFLSGQMFELSKLPQSVLKFSVYLPTTQINLILTQLWTGLKNPNIAIYWYIPILFIGVAFAIVLYRINNTEYK